MLRKGIALAALGVGALWLRREARAAATASAVADGGSTGGGAIGLAGGPEGAGSPNAPQRQGAAPAM